MNDPSPARRFVRVVIRDSAGRFLSIQHRSDRLWNFPGGKVEIGESPEAAARRETREEIGVHIFALRLLDEREMQFGGEWWLGSFYYAESFAGEPTPRESDKLSAMVFLSHSELLDRDGLNPYMIDLIEETPLYAIVPSVRY